MKNKRKLSYSFFLILVSLWLGWTVIIDMTVVPTVFRVVRDFFNAGDLGIALFSELNSLELMVASILVGLCAFQVKKNKASWPFFAMSVLGFFIVMFYYSYLTPKIITLTDLWEKAERLNQVSIAGFSDIQQEHQFFHQLYIKVDSAKLLILTIMLGYGVYREERWE